MPAGFRRQLAVAFALVSVCLAVILSVSMSTLSSWKVEEIMIDEAHKITTMFARQSTFALLYGSKEGAKIPIRAILDFPGVHGLALYDADGRLLYSEGIQEDRLKRAAWPAQPRLEGESESAWYFVAPVFIPDTLKGRKEKAARGSGDDRLIGFVQLVMGKEMLRDMEKQILWHNLAVSFLLAGVLLIVLLFILRRVTQPLSALACAMRRAGAGDKGVRAAIGGARDIAAMSRTFNALMEMRERHETELKVARDAALELARVKSEFAANVTHELRTPLNGVLGMLELLRDMGLTARQREYVEVAHNSAESLLALIDGILDFSRIDAGKFRPESVEFVLREVLEDVVQLLATQAQAKRLDLGYVIAPEVPSALRGDPRCIRQILLNLVGNAVKFTATGEVAIEVRLLSREEGRVLIRFDVSDSGCGISPAAQQVIFEPFSQVDGSTARAAGGAGLGLTISRQLVDFMGGEMDLLSLPGEGSTFWFTLPLEAVMQEEEPSGAHPQMTGVRVLVVDDSRIGREHLCQMVKSWGAVCHAVVDGRDALQALRNASRTGKPFQIAVIDRTMEEMRGSRLAKAVAEDEAIAPLAVILLDFESCRTERDAEWGIVDCLTKPVREGLFYDAVSVLMRRSRSEGVDREARASSPAVVGGPRILVAEDNQANQRVIRGMLERLGCRVEMASDGADVVAKARRGRYDMILMDCQMPGMDGIEATLSIRQEENQGQRVPVVAMTANVLERDIQRCLDAGMDDFLPKPIRLDTLESLLHRWLHRSPKGRRKPVRPLDAAVIEELKENIGNDLSALFDVFLEDSPIYLKAVSEAIDAKDGEALAEAAHAIKGSAGNIGASRMADIARELEQLGHRKAFEEARGELVALETELETVREALHTEIHGAPYERRTRPVEKQHTCVLIVDDDRGMRFALRKVVESAGYQVEEAANGAQAIAFCQNQIPDLILIDAMMPRMDGFTACRRIRGISGCRRIPVLMITALDDEDSIEKAFAAGATDYVPKPVHFGLLRQRISRLLEANHAEKQVHQLAYHDSLTELPNRTYFMEHLASLLRKKRPEGEYLALLFLDLDRFKLINDTLGHDIGDQLIRAVSGRISGCIRGSDLVARLGGDEFTILLEGIRTTDEAAGVADKICRVLSQPFVFSHREMHVSASIGIALSPDHGTDVNTLLRCADMAMFQAKEEGGDYRFYQPGMGTRVSKRLELETDLRRAQENDEFIVHYQPQRSLRNGEIGGVEALIRWSHPRYGIISPAEFIPLAEEMGLIVSLGDHVLYTACRQAKRWERKGCSTPKVAVNLSALQLEQEGLVARVAAILEETGLPADRLELEITESIIMKRAEGVVATLEGLRRLGVTLAIDDFGTGYSSLSYLRHFPIDVLKIDRSFIPRGVPCAEDVAVITSIISLAQKLNMIVVAEGVETREQFEFLELHGCDLVQGNYIGEPAAPDIFETRFLRSKREEEGIICAAS